MRRIRLPETNMAILQGSAPDCPEAIFEILGAAKGSAQTFFERGMDLDLIPALLDEDLDLQASDGQLLYADIRDLAERFLGVTAATKIGVRLERVDTDNCRLFHIDHVGVRLLTTYYGKGTEWLRNEDVMRAGLGQGSDELVRREGAPIQRLDPGWIALLKGEKGNSGRGLVHRSPPVEGSGCKRLLLRMDTLD
ncbi:MAG: DUF1826 domain-containing protein [Bdellovibrionota bacterium]